jgi:hypothetical protein
MIKVSRDFRQKSGRRGLCSPVVFLLSCLLPTYLAGCSAGQANSDDEDAGTGSTNQGTGAQQGDGDTGGTVGTGASQGDGDGDGDTANSGGQTGDGDGDGPPPVELPGGVVLDGNPEYYRVIRLTHAQWQNSVKDLLQLSDATGLVDAFFPDPSSGKFTNNERDLFIAEELQSDYYNAAAALAETIATDPAALTAVGDAASSTEFINTLGAQAFRRALTTEETAKYEALWAKGPEFFASGDNAVDGARVFLEALLLSPNFLFRLELTPTGQRLSGEELATKVSYLLRDTLPSEELLTAATSGELDTNAGLAAVVTAMLDEDSASDSLTEFHYELYELGRYLNIAKSTTSFPEYSDALNPVLLEADLLFFEHVYREGGGLRDILTSDVAYVNQETAEFYGLSAQGSALTEVTLDGSRPGFLTRLGFLTQNASRTQSDPIHRGVDINFKVLCADLPAPPPDVPALPEPVPGQTNRERVALHTSPQTCAGCHEQIINPIGFAFENYDAIGRVRTMDEGQEVDTASEYAFSDAVKPFADSNELIDLMVEGQQAHGCYSASLAEYVLTRDIASGEEGLVKNLQEMSLGTAASIKDLVVSMVQDPLFTDAQGGAQ